jgi:hypothetical protein
MIKFEDLPANTRALMLVKLASELNGQKSPSIYHLAKRQQTDVTGVWRGICRKANQPVCTIPIETIQAPRQKCDG